MKLRPALTLIEMMVSLSLIAVLVVPGVIVYNNIRVKQSLLVASENLGLVLQRAHVYSREERNSRMWGVRRVNSTTYELRNRDLSGTYSVTTYRLDNPITFQTSSFDLWFAQGTGEVNSPTTIVVRDPRNNQVRVEVTKLGVVTVR